MHFNARIFSELHELDELASTWRHLSGRTADNTGFFCSWEFVCTLLGSVPTQGWRVIALYPAGNATEAAAIFPLELLQVTMTEGVLRMARPLGLRYAPYTEFPVLREFRAEVWDALWGVLREHLACDAVFLGSMHEDSKNYLHLIEQLPRDHISVVRHPSQAFIDTRQLDFDTFFANSNKPMLREVRRRERRLQDLGTLEFALQDRADDVTSQVSALITLQVRHFGGAHYYGPESQWRPFFEQLFQNHAASGRVEFSTLRFKGEVIAAHLGFSYKGRRCYYMPAYSPDYARYSPSKILLAHLIERTFAEKGLFCFGAGAYAYKRLWSQEIAEAKLTFIFLNSKVRDWLMPFMTLQGMGQFLT